MAGFEFAIAGGIGIALASVIRSLLRRGKPHAAERHGNRSAG